MELTTQQILLLKKIIDAKLSKEELNQVIDKTKSILNKPKK
jgi:hypothetical protein